MGFGSVSSNDSSVTRSGINTANITITQPEPQQTRTGKFVSDTIVEIKTPLTSDEALGYTGLGNSFDKEAVQKEIDLQREVSQDFSKYSKRAAGELKTRIASNDAQYKAGLITEKERDARNATLRNYAWILETVSAGLATPSNSLGGSLVAAASPTIAGEIGKQFKLTGKQGSAGHYLAHAGLGAIVAAATGNSIASNALAAAGAEAAAPVAASWLYGKDVSQLTPGEKEIVSSIAGLAGAGLGGAVGGNGQSVVSGGVAGRTAVENNYLTSSQLEGFAQRARNCSGESCKKVIQDMVDTNIQQQEEMMAVCSASPEQCREKYGYLVDQWDAFDTTIKRLDADKTLPGKFRDYMPAVYMLDREAASLTAEYGWTKRLEAMGLDPETAQIVAAALPSMVGMPKGRSAGNGKVGIRQPSPNVKQHKEQIAAGKNAAEAQSPSVSTKALSSSKLSEAQRLDKKRELFDNFTGGASRTRKAQITIDGKAYKANPELSKNAAVFDGVPESKVKQYFMDLAGVEKLPAPQPMSKAVDVRGNPGMMYIVEKDGLKYNLRTGSSTVDQTQAKWTIEINGLKDHKINGRVLKNRRIEVKFR